MLFDGRTANRGWIQEAPEPMSTVTWGSWVDIHPKKARSLGHQRRRRGRAPVAEQTVTSRRLPGSRRRSPKDAVALSFGQGHTALGTNAANVGANAFLLLPGSPGIEGYFGRVTIRKTGRNEKTWPSA